MSALTTQELSDLWDALSPTQQGAVSRAIAAAHAQGREQGMMAAKEVCERIVKDNEYAYADECPGAITRAAAAMGGE